MSLKIVFFVQVKNKSTEIKFWTTLLLLAFVFNWIWEHFHSVLYIHYKGGEITDFILFRAALWDATAISLIVFISYLMFRRSNFIFIVSACLLLAIGLEKWALSTERWIYNTHMPIIPLIQTGLTPTIQLALLGSLAYFLARKVGSE